MGVEGNCGKIVLGVFIFVLTEPEQIWYRIRNCCVSVDFIAVRCYGCFSGLWVVAGKCRKRGEDIACCRYVHEIHCTEIVTAGAEGVNVLVS